MRRTIFVLALIAVLWIHAAPAMASPRPGRASAAFPYSREQTLGKTEGLILALGRDRWVVLYTEGDRDTTSRHSEAEEIFGAALERRNSRRIARLPAARRAYLRRLRDRLSAFEQHVIELHATLSGGGDTFRSARAAVRADVEEVIGRLTGDQGPKPSARRTRDVERRLDQFQQKVRASRSDRIVPAGETFSVEYGLKHLRQARAEFRALAMALRSARRREADLVLGACIDRLEGKLSTS
jgi:hypothetical protein